MVIIINLEFKTVFIIESQDLINNFGWWALSLLEFHKLIATVALTFGVGYSLRVLAVGGESLLAPILMVAIVAPAFSIVGPINMFTLCNQPQGL
jgi:hypothetical protein